MKRRCAALCDYRWLLVAGPAMARKTISTATRPASRPAGSAPRTRPAQKGAGARENSGAKGHAFDTIAVGRSHVLADIRGAGTIDRMWMTIEDRSPEALRGLKLEMFWDGASNAGGVGAARRLLPARRRRDGADGNGAVRQPRRPLVRLLRADAVPHGRADRRHQRIAQAGQSDLLRRQLSAAAAAAGGRALLPRLVEPRARDEAWPATSRSCRGSAGAAAFLARASPCSPTRSTRRPGGAKARSRSRSTATAATAPTLVGTGAEDYIGTAWGQGAYINRFQGAPIATWDDEGRWTFYRFHVPDPVWFHRDIGVTLQQIGGARKNIVLGLQNKGAPMIPVTIDPGSPQQFPEAARERQEAERPVAARRPHQLLPQRRRRRSRLFLPRSARACCRRSQPAAERMAAIRKATRKEIGRPRRTALTICFEAAA